MTYFTQDGAAIRMQHSAQVSVVISTFNGAGRLPGTLDAILAQDSSVPFELIVVDNNSIDATASLLESYAVRAPECVTHLFEARQGVSFGRNAGIARTRAPVVAFTDDDVMPARDWVSNIHRAFADRPEIDYVTGKVIPAYDVPPPRWLTRANSGPCVLRDRGDKPVLSKPGCFFPGWATVNIAFRRTVFERIGLFSGDFPRGQDLEFIIRLWAANGRGLYSPDVVVTHRVPAERLTKTYHRMWHTREGSIRARVRFREIFDKNDRITIVPRDGRGTARVPLFLWRNLATAWASWGMAKIVGSESSAFYYECQTRQTLSYIRTRLLARFRREAARLGTGE